MMIEVPVSEIKEDSKFPDQDTRHIYDHLKYTLSRPCQFPLPAIKVAQTEKGLVVVGGHQYLRIARELGKSTIRALLPSGGSPSSELLKRLPAGTQLVPREVLEQETSLPVVRDFHVYFFAEPLSEHAKSQFLSNIAGFFKGLKTPLLKPADRELLSWAFPFKGYCAEFEANIPVGDKSWLEQYLRVSREFSRNVARIVSFQGAHFPN